MTESKSFAFEAKQSRLLCSIPRLEARRDPRGVPSADKGSRQNYELLETLRVVRPHRTDRNERLRLSGTDRDMLDKAIARSFFRSARALV